MKRSQSRSVMDIQCLVELNNDVGEVPFWDLVSQSLYWVDMTQNCIYCFDTRSKKLTQWATPKNVAGVFTTNDPHHLLVLLADGLTLFHKDKQSFEYVCQPNITQGSVFNESKQDRYGRVWALTKAANHKDPIAGLYYFDSGYQCHQLDDGFTIGNGVGFSLDEKWFYTGCSVKREIYRYPLEMAQAQLGQREVLITIAVEDGLPDGLCVDAQGNIWCALWSGSQLICYAPNGRVKQRINMPIQNPTSCCFGGKDMQTLFVTSAAYQLSKEALLEQPLAGSVFKVTL